MYARLRALGCLLVVSTAVIRSEPAGSVVVYFQADSASSQAVLNVMRQQLNALMQPGGLRVEWRDLVSGKRDSGASHVAVVEFRGACSPPADDATSASLESLPPLASTSVVDGHVLPFSWVDCEALSRFLGSSLRKESDARRNQLYGRAVARLVAHEIYHIVTRAEVHTRAGVAKPRFTLSDLLSERFEFEGAALARLRQPSDSAQDTSGEDVSGR